MHELSVLHCSQEQVCVGGCRCGCGWVWTWVCVCFPCAVPVVPCDFLVMGCYIRPAGLRLGGQWTVDRTIEQGIVITIIITICGW